MINAKRRGCKDTYLCIPCRKVFKVAKFTRSEVKCPNCGAFSKNMGSRWRPPKLTKDSAWKLIQGGETLWDGKAVEKSRPWANPYRKEWRDLRLEEERRKNPKYRKSGADDV